ncbi:MAG: hypothetical protein ACT4OQ_13215 [Chloroflexota bacterium]
MASKNAKVIIPFVLVAWLGSVLLLQPGTPALVEVAFFVAIGIAIPVMVFYLMAEMGWSSLAGRYRASEAFNGPWTPCPTGQMAHVSVHDPEFQRNKMRLVGGTLRIGTTSDALHLSMLFSKVPILGRFFPDVQIPWSAVTKATTFEAPGWFRPPSQPGTLFQAGYDPNYTGTFIELVVGEPPVFMQLPEKLIGEGMAHLRLSSDGGSSSAPETHRTAEAER